MTEQGVRTRLWRNGVVDKEDFPFEDISEYLDQPGCLVWVDVGDPNDERLVKLAGELSLDPLAVEDAAAHRERPKINRYDSHIFVTAYAVDLERESGELLQTQVSAFVLKQALVTVHRDEWFDIDDVVKRWDEERGLCDYGSKALMYGMLDVLVDGHFAVIEALDDEIEALEDILFDESSHVRMVQRRTFALRKSLVQARRVILPMREVVNTMMRHAQDDELHPDLRPYFEDLYDHVLRASEWTESLRDMISTLFETNLSLQDSRLNTIMKKLTAWAAIIAIPTAVTGFYGQNVPYPGFSEHSGFYTSAGIIIGLVVFLYLMFRRRDWL
ncbi:MAG: Mg2 transporter protein CorA family protein [Frankiales bacterium]|nr:Mg2 transporter protein CorA family protein [Frankiales bacterium]